MVRGRPIRAPTSTLQEATHGRRVGHVTFYVSTPDPAATLRRVEELGGTVIIPLTEVAPDTNVALFTDPEVTSSG